MIYDAPVFFEKNRVFRVYTGGKLFDSFLKDGSTDGFYPEEWVASSVKALNKDSQVYKEGVSKVAESDLYLDELLETYSKEMLGDKEELGILVKYLDSAIRLPIQVHPSKQYALQHFGSAHGKEECWIVLATRPGGCVYFGFEDGVTREDFDRALKESETDADAMVKLLKRHEVQAGDVIFIPACAVHAIGAGCLILEVQEPTDFTIQPEPKCGDYELSEFEKYLGLEKETALECFSFEPVKQVKVPPVVVSREDNVLIESLISSVQTESFRINRITLNNGTYTLGQPAAVYCVVEGNGEISGDQYVKTVKQGDYFLLPATAAGNYTFQGENLTVVECFQ